MALRSTTTFSSLAASMIVIQLRPLSRFRARSLSYRNQSLLEKTRGSSCAQGIRALEKRLIFPIGFYDTKIISQLMRNEEDLAAEFSQPNRRIDYFRSPPSSSNPVRTFLEIARFLPLLSATRVTLSKLFSTGPRSPSMKRL